MKRLIFSLPLLLLAACSASTDYLAIPVDIPGPERAALDNQARIYYLDFLLGVKGSSYDPTEQIRKYFSGDFSSYYSVKVVPVSLAGWDQVRKEKADAFSFAAPDFFQKLLDGYPRALFLTGRLKGEIKSTSIIREVKNDKGVKQNAFVPQQVWDTECHVYVIDADSGQIVSEREQKEKSTVTASISPGFEYQRLLEKILEKMQPDFQNRPHRQMRALLLK